MSTIFVEDVREESLARLRAGADAHGMSLQAELQLILEAAAEEQALRGWRQESLAAKHEEAELDSVGQLEQYMATCWPNVQGWTKA